jgi:hypothetical protein
MKQLAIRLSWQTTPAKSLVMFERVARVPQPPDQPSNAGYPAGAANRGGIFFGSFLLAAQKKGASCRSTTGGFDFDCCMHHKAPAALRRPFDKLRANGLNEATLRSRHIEQQHFRILRGTQLNRRLSLIHQRIPRSKRVAVGLQTAPRDMQIGFAPRGDRMIQCFRAV